MPHGALVNFAFLFLLPELECRASFPITLNPLSGLSRHICSLQLQLPHLGHTQLSPHPWVRRPRAAKGSSGARQETALQIWLSSFQQSPNSTACLNQGRENIHVEGRGRSWVAGSLVKGMNPRSQGRPTLQPCSRENLQLVGQEVTWRLSAPWEQAASSSSGGGGLSLREWGEKQRRGFRDRAGLDP